MVMDYLYHVTWLKNIESIVDHEALVPSARPSNFSGGLDAHSQGRLFWADADAAGCWFEKIENLMIHESDDPEADELVPVILRFPRSSLEDIQHDAPGSRDCPNGESYFTEGPTDPDEFFWFDAWDGTQWVDVDMFVGFKGDHPPFDSEGYFVGYPMPPEFDE